MTGPLYGSSSVPPPGPQFDDLERVQTHGILMGEPGPLHQFDQARFDELRTLGKDAIWFGQYNLFGYGAYWHLRPDYLQSWAVAKPLVYTPNQDVVKYFYMEEIYSNTNNIAQTNADLATACALIKSDCPDLKIIYAAHWHVLQGQSTPPSVIIPDDVDVVAISAYYPISGSANFAGIRRGLNSVLRPGQKIGLIPPGLDGATYSEIDRARILDQWLELARVDPRVTHIMPYTWWYSNAQAQEPMYYAPPGSGYAARWAALGQSVREKYRFSDFGIGNPPQSLGCPAGGHLAAFSALAPEPGVDMVLEYRSIVPLGIPLAALVAVVGFGYDPIPCGYILGPSGSIVTQLVPLDHADRFFLRQTYSGLGFDAFFQVATLDANSNMQTSNVVRVNY